jgi:hypothetical protein
MKDTISVTDLEKEVIDNIIHSEYMDVRDERMIDWSVWSFSATNQNKQLAGALGSLVKKGLVSSDDTEEEPTCALTKDGFDWAKNNGLV